VKTSIYTQGNDYFRHNGAGEMLVFSAADFEDFRHRARTCRQRWSVSWRTWCAPGFDRWPWRLHATYDEPISRALDVYEQSGARDHACCRG